MTAMERLTIKLAEMSLEPGHPSERDVDDLRALLIAARMDVPRLEPNDPPGWPVRAGPLADQDAHHAARLDILRGNYWPMREPSAPASTPPSPPPEWRQVNLNAKVRVKLTALGRHVWKDHWGRFTPAPTLSPDSDGFYVTQLWCLMNEFGNCLSNGSRLPFESAEIEIGPV